MVHKHGSAARLVMIGASQIPCRVETMVCRPPVGQGESTVQLTKRRRRPRQMGEKGVQVGHVDEHPS